ncbi:MAG TPA: hypothetical protein VF701_07870 [Thermoanaerobaculia bacterium]
MVDQKSIRLGPATRFRGFLQSSQRVAAAEGVLTDRGIEAQQVCSCFAT